MNDQTFQIKIIDLHWINNVDDPKDLCAHGLVYIRIGDQIISDENSGNWTLSSTALYLLRTIKDNYNPNDFPSQLVPCCGHFRIIDEKTNKVLIFGCPLGIDWTIVHDGDEIKHISEDGEESILHKDEYKKIVFDFADTVEKFYKDSTPKVIPDDESDRNAYLLFWTEWRDLRHS